MSNEVIIDGCNVAECDFYDRYNYTTCLIGIDDYIDCDKHPNCMFKQLQRAKAELEQYKKSKQASYETMQREWQGAVHLLRGVQAENERLKKEVKEIRTWEELKLSKYRKALEEMKEIANHLKEDTGKYDIYDISDKINEVLND